MTKNKTLAEHHDGGPEGQGGAQQGTGARGEQYLDALARSHKIARKVLFGTSTGSAPEQIHTSRKKSSLTDCPFFRSKRTIVENMPSHFHEEVVYFLRYKIFLLLRRL